MTDNNQSVPPINPSPAPNPVTIGGTPDQPPIVTTLQAQVLDQQRQIEELVTTRRQMRRQLLEAESMLSNAQPNAEQVVLEKLAAAESRIAELESDPPAPGFDPPQVRVFTVTINPHDRQYNIECENAEVNESGAALFYSDLSLILALPKGRWNSIVAKGTAQIDDYSEDGKVIEQK